MPKPEVSVTLFIVRRRSIHLRPVMQIVTFEELLESELAELRRLLNEYEGRKLAEQYGYAKAEETENA